MKTMRRKKRRKLSLKNILKNPAAAGFFYWNHIFPEALTRRNGEECCLANLFAL